MTELITLSLHDALPICRAVVRHHRDDHPVLAPQQMGGHDAAAVHRLGDVRVGAQLYDLAVECVGSGYWLLVIGCRFVVYGCRVVGCGWWFGGFVVWVVMERWLGCWVT